ncbi:hypothetical protein FKM82_022706 [Ascaphus truei]
MYYLFYSVPRTYLKTRVPGDLGNQLEAKLDKQSVVHYVCSKKTDYYFTLWLNLELLLPLVIDCWIDNIRLVYNRTSRTTASPDGVDVRVPGFGFTYPLEFLDPSKRSVGIYFYTLVQNMVDWGYTRDKDVRGAPYDWRKAPSKAQLLLVHIVCTLSIFLFSAPKPGGGGKKPPPSPISHLCS